LKLIIANKTFVLKGGNLMIPKSIIELTINTFQNDLKELEKINNREMARGRDGYGETNYIHILRRNIDTYKMLIKEYEKYLEENYGESKTEISGFTKSVIERIQAKNSRIEGLDVANGSNTAARKGC
jgi:hypothetical protein